MYANNLLSSSRLSMEIRIKFPFVVQINVFVIIHIWYQGNMSLYHWNLFPMNWNSKIFICFDFRLSVNLRRTNQCCTKTTLTIYDISVSSPSPGPERRPTDQDSVHSSSEPTPCCCQPTVSIFVLFCFMLCFYVFLLDYYYYLCFICCPFSLTIDLTVTYPKTLLKKWREINGSLLLLRM